MTKMKAVEGMPLLRGQLKKNSWGPKMKLSVDVQSYHSSLQGSIWILRLERGREKDRGSSLISVLY